MTSLVPPNYLERNSRSNKNLGPQSGIQPAGYKTRDTHGYDLISNNTLKDFSQGTERGSYNNRQYINQSKVKEARLLGSYPLDSALNRDVISKVGSRADRDYGAKGAGVQSNSEIRSFLSQIPSSGNVLEHGGVGRSEDPSNKEMLGSLVKDPNDEQAKRKQRQDEWKRSLDLQRNDRELKKKQELELQRLEDLKDEERIRKQLIDTNEAYNQDNYPKVREDVYHERPSHNPNLTSIPEAYSSPVKRMTFENLIELHSTLPSRPEIEFRTNVLLSTQITPINNHIDQLKADLFRSQKLFGEKTKEIKDQFEQSNQARMMAEKNMILLSKKQHALNIPHNSVDILDDYLMKYGLLKGKDEKTYKSKFMQNIYHNPYSKPAFMINPENPLDKIESRAKSLSTGITRDQTKSIKDRSDFNYRGASTKVKIPQRSDDLNNQPSSRGLYGAREYSVGKMDDSWQQRYNTRENVGRRQDKNIDNNEAKMELNGMRQEIPYREEDNNKDESDFGDLTQEDMKKQYIDLEEMINKIDIVQSKKTSIGQKTNKSSMNRDVDVSFSDLDDKMNKNQMLISRDSTTDGFKSSIGKSNLVVNKRAPSAKKVRIQTPESNDQDIGRAVIGKQTSVFVDTKNMQTLGYRSEEDMDKGQMLTLDEEGSEPDGGYSDRG